MVETTLRAGRSAWGWLVWLGPVAVTLMPVFGIPNLSVSEIVHFSVVVGSLWLLALVWFLEARGTGDGHSADINVFSSATARFLVGILYLQYIVVRYFPTGRWAFDGVAVAAMLAGGSYSILMILDARRRGETFWPGSGTMRTATLSALGICGYLGLVVLFDWYKDSPITGKSALKFLACLTVYPAAVLLFRREPAIDRKLRFWSSATLLLSMVVVVVGLARYAAVIQSRAEAHRLHAVGEASESGALLLRSLPGTWPEVAFDDADLALLLEVAAAIAPDSTETPVALALISAAGGQMDRFDTEMGEALFEARLGVGDSFAWQGMVEQARSWFDLAASETDDPFKALEFLRDRYPPALAQRLWSGNPRVRISSFEAGVPQYAGHWAAGPGVAGSRGGFSVADGIARTGRYSLRLDVDYDEQERVAVGRRFDFWSIKHRILPPTSSGGIRLYVRGADGCTAEVALVLNTRLENTTGCRWSSPVRLSKQWQALEIRGLDRPHPTVSDQRVIVFDQLAIDTYGRRVSLYIDDVQLFTHE